MSDWINSNAGLVVIGFIILFFVLLAFQRTKGGPI